MTGPLETRAIVDVSQIIDRNKLSPFQWRILALCAVCLIMDGFDTQAMAYVAPVLSREWAIPRQVLGPIFSAALIGVLIGSLCASMLADRIGRRPVLIGAALYFSLLTLLTAQVTSTTALFWIRLVSGIGLGSIMPNAMALTGEYTPARIRVIAMVIVSNGFTIGAAIGGGIAAWLIPTFGWRSVFYFGGTVSLVIAVLMVFGVPESLQFMVLRMRGQRLIERYMRRIDPTVPSGDSVEYRVKEKMGQGVPAIHLFRERRIAMTLLLWTISFMNLLNLYFLGSWIPTVVHDAGFSTTKAVLAGTVLQIGGVLGSFAAGLLIEKRGFVATLIPTFLVACVSIISIGQGLGVGLLFTAIFFAGWGIVGGQPAINALAAVYYPTYLRATGIGWVLGIGRIGAIVGPSIGGQLIGLKWSNRELFLAASVPALISALITLVMSVVWKPSQPNMEN